MKKLVVIDDEYLVIEGIRVMLKRIGKDYELVGSASDGQTALELIENVHPDVVFVDIRMPGLSGHRIHRYCQVPLSGKRDRDLSLLPVQSPADSGKREFCPFQSGLLLRRLYGRIHRTNTEGEYEKHSQYR